jgi:hypothetical protein
MTVLTPEQAAKVAPEAFGLGPPPDLCELCQLPWTDQGDPTKTPYGPFIIWCHPECSQKMLNRRNPTE